MCLHLHNVKDFNEYDNMAAIPRSKKGVILFSD